MRAGPRTALLALGTACALGLGRFAQGLVAPSMREDLHWGLTEIGVLTAANGVGYLLGALLTAALAARAGLTRTFRLGMVLCCAGLALMACGDVLGLLMTGRALSGLGGALVFITGALISPTRAFFAGTGLGMIVSAVVVGPFLDDHVDRWPGAWAMLAALALVCCAASWSAARTAAEAPTRARPAVPRHLTSLALVYLLFAAGYVSYVTFLTAYLADRQVPVLQATATWVVIGAAVVIAPRVWRSWPTDARLLAVLLALVGAAAGLVVISTAWPVVLLSGLVYGVTFMMVPSTVTGIARGTVRPDVLAATLGALTVVFATGQALGPWLAAEVAELTAPWTALGWTVVLCGAGAVVALSVHRSPVTTRPDA